MTVAVERRGRILVVSLQREAKRNALNAEITAGVDAAMNELEDDPELWCGVLTGDGLTAERAERLGFVNVLTEPGGALAGALALAERVVANARRAVREALVVVREVVAADEERLWAASDEAHARLVVTDDVREGIDAFFAKRAPEWKDR